MAHILLCSSAVRVHDSHRKMDVTKEHISCILELTEVLLSFQTGFNLVNAVVVCAILESISGRNSGKLNPVQDGFEKNSTIKEVGGAYAERHYWEVLGLAGASWQLRCWVL